MPRQARLDSPGTLHHLIVRGIERSRIVADREDQAAVVARHVGGLTSGISIAISTAER